MGLVYTFRQMASRYAILRLSLSLSLFFPGFSLCALAQESGVVSSQPGGPSMVLPICHECEFDPNGDRTKFGQRIDGRFQGATVHPFFDGQGHVTERIAEDFTSGETVRREIVEPFG